MQVLVLVRTPPPHSTEHSDQGPKAVYLPSTDSNVYCQLFDLIVESLNLVVYFSAVSQSELKLQC